MTAGTTQRREGRSSPRTVNITMPERVGRVIVGLVAVIAAIVLLSGVSSVAALGLELLLVLAGVDLLVPACRGTARCTRSWAACLGSYGSAMTAPQDRRTGDPMRPVARRHGAHGRMMVACRVPMLVIAIVLVATGVVGNGFLVLAVGCTLMMALLMAGMGRGSRDRRS